MQDAEVTTIEGMAWPDGLHPLQRALVDASAIQGGFCTPSYVLRLYALCSKDPGAEEEAIREALSHHLCRCTGYETIWEGALLAQKYLRQGS